MPKVPPAALKLLPSFQLSVSRDPMGNPYSLAFPTSLPALQRMQSGNFPDTSQSAMAVLPASYKVSFDLLKEAAGAGKVELANEQEFRDMFPELEVGAMPPFGNLYGMEVFVDESLSQDDEIAFNDGSHTELMRLAYRDFDRLVKPKAAKFAAR
jgi:Ala-tRNA(Pro) deacylase